MKNIEVIFQNGRLVDFNTKKEVFLVPGRHYYINGDDDAFLNKSFLEKEVKPLKSKEKKNQIENRYKGFVIEKILPAKTILYFRIGLGRITEEDKGNEYLFKAEICEDLYLKSKNREKWSLCECHCKSDEITEGKLLFIQTVKGTSLSNLFANVVTHYFAMKRSTACNAFKTFVQFPEQMNPSLYLYKRDLRNYYIDNKRTEVERKVE